MKRTILLMCLLASLAVVSSAGGQPFVLAGAQNYWYYAAKTDEILQDGDCPAIAILQFLDGQDVMLIVSEHYPCAPPGEQRTFPLFGKMTPSGSVKLWFPDFIPIVDILKGHTGCTVAGPFGEYHGKLEDGVLHVETHFHSQCKEYWPANDLWATPVDGPVHGKWTLHVEVVAP